MSEMDVRQDGGQVELDGLMKWAAEARQVAVIAESLARTSFVPRAFQGKPAEVTAAILAGQEVGMSPMAALRSIDVIQGKPAMSALAMRGLVQSHGHRISVLEQTETRAIVEGQRHGEGTTQRSTWTIERAKKLGLVGKENWRTQPQAMLVARATAECARLTAADVLLGMPYSVEELADVAAEQPAGGGQAATVKRTARRAALPSPDQVEPTLDEPVAQPKPVETDGATPEPEFGPEEQQ